MKESTLFGPQLLLSGFSLAMRKIVQIEKSGNAETQTMIICKLVTGKCYKILEDRNITYFYETETEILEDRNITYFRY